MKTCTLCNLQCRYAFMNSGTIGFGCNYNGYCDYQLPKDSRFPSSFDNLGASNLQRELQ